MYLVTVNRHRNRIVTVALIIKIWVTVDNRQCMKKVEPIRNTLFSRRMKKQCLSLRIVTVALIIKKDLVYLFKYRV